MQSSSRRGERPDGASDQSRKVSAVLAYATIVYPILPIWLGGGLPENGRVELGHPLESCAIRTSADVQLIDEHDARVVCALDQPVGG
jgi:hypothetical protein